MVALVVGLGLVVVYSLGQWRSVADLFQRRQARYGTLAASGVLLGLAILVAANYILARQNTRWDLTAARQYSLSDQTVRILESLESPIRVLVFAQELDFPRYRDRLGEYEYTSSQVSLELIDPDKNPFWRGSTKCRRTAPWCSTTTAGSSASSPIRSRT